MNLIGLLEDKKKTNTKIYRYIEDHMKNLSLKMQVKMF